MVEYLVVTMHQAHMCLTLRLSPCLFFKCQALPYSISSYQAIVPNNSIIRNQLPPLSIRLTALARFDPRATLVFTFLQACGPNYAFTRLSVPRPSIIYRNHALQPMQL